MRGILSTVLKLYMLPAYLYCMRLGYMQLIVSIIGTLYHSLYVQYYLCLYTSLLSEPVYLFYRQIKRRHRRHH